MSRYYYNRKSTVEECHSIDTKFLKKHNYLELNTVKSGSIVWKSNNKETGRVGITVNSSNKYINFSYRSRKNNEDEWKDKNYNVSLTSTQCHFGGQRYWFICSCCSRRVGSLYIDGGSSFACRSCLNLTYVSNNRSKQYRFLDKFYTSNVVDEKIWKLRNKYYQGKPTKKYQKLLDKKDRCIGTAESLLLGGVI